MSSPRVLWHASRANINRPTISGRTEGSHHANSGLGIFCATAPHEYLSGFGSSFHALTLSPDARALKMWTRDLARMGRGNWEEGDNDRQWFEQEGRRLGKEYDIIELVEIEGNVEQVIILNDEVVLSSAKLSLDEFQGVCQPDPNSPEGRRRRLSP